MSFAARRQSRGSVSVLGTVAALALATGCAGPAWPEPPSLVRDAAGIFSPTAEMEADGRLRQLAREHGVWVFVVTHPRPDPPRVIEESMGQAGEAGVQAVGFILDFDGVVATARSGRPGDLQDLLLEAMPDASLTWGPDSGTADEALGRFVLRTEGILDDR